MSPGPAVAAGAIRGPLERGGYWLWEGGEDGVRVLFAGVGPDPRPELPREAILAAVAPAAGEQAGPDAPAAGLAMARQIHSARVLTAEGPGRCGEGDALIGRRPLLALTVITADCVPLLLAAGEWMAAVHAGWRGIAGGVVAATVERLAAAGAPEPAGWTAWIGPAIGPCCYEVSEEVAAEVAAASAPEVVVASGGPRPHLDLGAAVVRQLAAAGVVAIHRVDACTRCDGERLWSYRRLGKGAGRNLAAIWKL